MPVVLLLYERVGRRNGVVNTLEICSIAKSIKYVAIR